MANLSLDFADGAEIHVPFSSLGCCADWCASCKQKPPSACCESGGCCVKGGRCACWTDPYLVLRPRTLELDAPLTLSLNDSIMISDITSIISDPSKLLKTLVVAVTERPYIKAAAALRCCRDWICFPFMQLFSLCANTCLLPCVARGLSKRLVGKTFGPGKTRLPDPDLSPRDAAPVSSQGFPSFGTITLGPGNNVNSMCAAWE